jgi:hypothetical protein
MEEHFQGVPDQTTSSDFGSISPLPGGIAQNLAQFDHRWTLV